MPLVEKGVFGVICFFATIHVRVFPTVTKIIEDTKEPLHFRVLNLSPRINYGVVQPVMNARGAHHGSGVENRGAGTDFLNRRCGSISRYINIAYMRRRTPRIAYAE